ncbi:MAG: DUF502 domain-containing protein [Acidobacteriota bacterium]
MSRTRPDDRSPFGRIRRLFLTGFAILLPLIITVWILGLLFDLVRGITTPFILKILKWTRFPYADDPAFTTYLAPLIGFVLTVLLVLLVGILATNLLGRRIVTAFDRLMLRIPLIKGIYGAARQLLDAFNAKTTSFQRVVAVEYPSEGLYTLGFVTRDPAGLHSVGGGPELPGYTLVFLPTSPNPTSGWLLAVPEKRLVPLDMSIEEGVKMVVSGGLVVPQRWIGP